MSALPGVKVATDQSRPLPSAADIAADGLCRLEQGQPPVLPFQGITEPEQAFEAAVVAWAVGTAARKYGYHQELRLAGPRTYELTPTEVFGEVFAAIAAIGNIFFSLRRGDDVPVEQTPAGESLSVGNQLFHITDLTLQVVIDGITVRLNKYTSPLDATREWRRAKLGAIRATSVGPVIPLCSEAEVEAYKELVRQDQRRQECDRQERLEACWRKQTELAARLADAAPINWSLPHMWAVLQAVAGHDRNGALQAAETWAHLIEATMAAKGRSLRDCAKGIYLEVQEAYHLTTDQTDLVTYILEQVWMYGPELRKYWKELETERPPYPGVALTD